jgi:hypothetical protein
LDEFEKKLNASKVGSFTVVHWRRGDQLSSRCSSGVDVTVNCGSAEDLVKRVRSVSDDKVVYVATNELQNSKEMKSLRRMGFLTFSDIKLNNFVEIDPFHGVVLEVALMLRASTFLGWGVSEISAYSIILS